LFKDIEHLIRLVAVIVVLLAIFVVLRVAVVPRSFGQYGHYRGAAIAETAARPIAFAGHDACEVCHTDVRGSRVSTWWLPARPAMEPWPSMPTIPRR
jgi:hypothetical protein